MSASKVGRLVMAVLPDDIIYLNDLVNIRVYKDRAAVKISIEAPKEVIIKRVKDKSR